MLGYISQATAGIWGQRGNLLCPGLGTGKAFGASVSSLTCVLPHLEVLTKHEVVWEATRPRSHGFLCVTLGKLLSYSGPGFLYRILVPSSENFPDPGWWQAWHGNRSSTPLSVTQGLVPGAQASGSSPPQP